MKKFTCIFLVVIMVMLLLPVSVYAAASAKFSISGPSTLSKGQSGTYTVSVTVSDAIGVQADLVYDASFFKLVSGNPKGVWDNAGNTSTTVSLITVTLECIAEQGTSGSLSLSGVIAQRLSDIGIPEDVSTSGGSKTVTNPVVLPTPSPTPKPTPGPTPTPGPKPTPGPTTETTVGPTETTIISSETTVETPTTAPNPWETIAGDLGGTQPGGTFTAQMQDDPMMPVDVLELLKEKQGVLEMNFGDYTCTIDGNDLKDIPADLINLDLSLNMEYDEQLSLAAEGSDVYQLHFGYHGELPGKFTFKIKADKSKPGDTVYLYYYYDQAGVLEGIQSAVVDADNYLTFEIYHCSDYFISDKIIPGAVHSFSAAAVTPTNPTGSQSAGVSILVLLLCIFGAALIGSLSTMFIGKTGFFKAKASEK